MAMKNKQDTANIWTLWYRQIWIKNSFIERYRTMNKVFWIFLVLLCFKVCAAEEDGLKVFNSQSDIEKITSKINLGQVTLKEKLDYYGIKPTSVSVHKMNKTDVIEDPRMTIGDIEYSVDFAPGRLTEMCNILGTADFLYHKHKVRPETKTANWLVTGRCELPPEIK